MGTIQQIESKDTKFEKPNLNKFNDEIFIPIYFYYKSLIVNT